MIRSLYSLRHDEAGFVVSAELVLIASIEVLSMVVGMSEVSLAVHRELQDVSGAYGSANQGSRYRGLTGNVGLNNGNALGDATDLCHGTQNIVNASQTSAPSGI